MIHLVYSNQSSEIKKVVKGIAKQSLPERDDMNFVRYDGNNTLIQEIIDDANYVPLGYDKKVVAVDNCYFLMKPKPRNKIEADQDYKALISYIKNPNPDCDLILTVPTAEVDKNGELFKLIETNAKVTFMGDPTIKEWNDYVRKIVNDSIEKNPGSKMDSDALMELIDRTAGDIPLLKNSIIKLFLYTKHVRYEDVLLLVTRPLEDNTFQLFNYLLDGENEKAIGLFRDLQVSNVEPVTLISMLGNQFRLLNQVVFLSKQSKTNDEIAEELKIKPIRVQILKKKTFNMSEKAIHKTLDDLFNLDLQIKSGLVDRFYAFELFLINFKRD